MKKALITGIAGQDGSYLAELLLNEGYEVHGIELPFSPEDSDTCLRNIAHLQEKVHLYFGSVADRLFISALVQKLQPNECYHLAAVSHVSYIFEEESSVLSKNIKNTHVLLSVIKEETPECRFFFAGSSEQFGSVESSPQDESTPFRPRSIYGISKVAGYNLVDYYRREHKLFSCTGILYNHESPRRGMQFVTRKITSTAAKIKAGLEDKLYLGNLDALRDWGYAPDYVRAMWLMLQQDSAEDYVIATGITHSVREFADAAFQAVDLDYRDYVIVDQRFYREGETTPLCGNPGRIRARLGWENGKLFQAMVQEMVLADLRGIRRGNF